jgi:hypothetical protein
MGWLQVVLEHRQHDAALTRALASTMPYFIAAVADAAQNPTRPPPLPPCMPRVTTRAEKEEDGVEEGVGVLDLVQLQVAIDCAGNEQEDDNIQPSPRQPPAAQAGQAPPADTHKEEEEEEVESEAGRSAHKTEEEEEERARQQAGAGREMITQVLTAAHSLVSHPVPPQILPN